MTMIVEAFDQPLRHQAPNKRETQIQDSCYCLTWPNCPSAKDRQFGRRDVRMNIESVSNMMFTISGHLLIVCVMT